MYELSAEFESRVELGKRIGWKQERSAQLQLSTVKALSAWLGGVA